jgi:photosystem II stability/assembly factor-like uncharacterized protein
MSKALTTRKGALFIQPGGPAPNNDVEFLKCRTLGDITETGTGVELIQCFDDSGEGWETVGEKLTPPEPITYNIDGLLYKELGWLERIKCPFSVYVLMRNCGRPDHIDNYDRGFVLNNNTFASKTYSNLVDMKEDVESTFSSSLIARPPMLHVQALEVSREVTTAADGLNDVIATDERRCPGDCGEFLEPCENGMVVGDSAVAPAFASLEVSADFAETWAHAGADPFAAGSGATSVTQFWVGRTTFRYLVAMTAPAGAQGMIAYTDDAGGNWTAVNLGGALTGDGASYGGALWSLDQYHIWLAGANGYIWFSGDAGVTWAAQEAGVIHAGIYNFCHFADENYGLAGGAAGIIALTSDGGQAWTAGTATGGSVLCGWRFDANRILVGDDAGALYYSDDGAVTWTQITTFTGSGVGDIRDLHFWNDQIGIMVYDSVAPLGELKYTFTGGRHWVDLTTPVNTGLNAVWMCDESHGLAVGEVNAATGVILKFGPAEEI